MPGHFEKALQDGEAYEVLMNEVLFVSFVPGSECRSIGTANLNSCTSVMIVSQHGAILAHIAPRPDDANKDDLLAGVRHLTQKMDDFGALYQQTQQFFPKENPSWVVSAIFQERIALPDQKDIIESKFRNWGLSPVDVNYNVVHPPLPKNGKGTVFIDGRKGGFPAVYLEDNLIYGGFTVSVDSIQAGSQQGSMLGTAPKPSIKASSKISKKPSIKHAKPHSSQTSPDKSSQSQSFMSSEGIQRVVIEADISHYLPGASIKLARKNDDDGYRISVEAGEDDLLGLVRCLKADTLSWSQEGGSCIGSKTYLKRRGLLDVDVDDDEDGDNTRRE